MTAFEEPGGSQVFADRSCFRSEDGRTGSPSRGGTVNGFFFFFMGEKRSEGRRLAFCTCVGPRYGGRKLDRRASYLAGGMMQGWGAKEQER